MPTGGFMAAGMIPLLQMYPPTGSQHFSLPKSPLSYSFIEVEVEKGAIQARG